MGEYRLAAALAFICVFYYSYYETASCSCCLTEPSSGVKEFLIRFVMALTPPCLLVELLIFLMRPKLLTRDIEVKTL